MEGVAALGAGRREEWREVGVVRPEVGIEDEPKTEGVSRPVGIEEGGGPDEEGWVGFEEEEAIDRWVFVEDFFDSFKRSWGID